MHLPRRFDTDLMDPPEALGAGDAAFADQLRTWCEGGAFPALVEPLRVTTIAPHAGLDAAALALDGSHELARLGRWRGLAWRLQILWRECVLSGASRHQDPWDCGWWRAGSLASAHAFLPRRATLLMVRQADDAAAPALLAALQARSRSYAHPVRVLRVSAAAPPEGGFS